MHEILITSLFITDVENLNSIDSGNSELTIVDQRSMNLPFPHVQFTVQPEKHYIICKTSGLAYLVTKMN